MTEAQTQAGFTIIELVLFLALSSLMIIAAMIAVSGRTQQVQYTDSTRLTESFFESRQTQALNGVLRDETEQCSYSLGAYTGGSNDGSCVFLGYLFEAFPSTSENSIDVYQVFGKRIASNDPCLELPANVNDPLACAEPRLAPVTAAVAQPIESFDMPWALTVSQLTNGGTDVNMFGYLRNPVGQELIPVAFTAGTQADANSPAAYRQGYATSFIGSEFNVTMCTTNTRKPAAIQFGAGESKLSIDALFDDAEPLCP